ncbi:unnamed protein product, partial [marine sediment metagenome]
IPGLDEATPAISYEVLPMRANAIERALTLANEDDVVLIAGKGHEDYQEISGVRHPFSDLDICKQALRVNAND